MRINVYSQELMLDDMRSPAEAVELVEQQANTGITYSAVRLILHSSERLHHPPKDDDRSAITFWLPRSEDRRARLATTFRTLANLIEMALPETGMD